MISFTSIESTFTFVYEAIFIYRFKLIKLQYVLTIEIFSQIMQGIYTTSSIYTVIYLTCQIRTIVINCFYFFSATAKHMFF